MIKETQVTSSCAHLMRKSWSEVMVGEVWFSAIQKYRQHKTDHHNTSSVNTFGKVAHIPSPATGSSCMNASFTAVDDYNQLLVNLHHLGSWIFAMKGEVSTNNDPLGCIIKASLQLNSSHSNALCYDKRGVEWKESSERDTKRSFPFITVIARIFSSMLFDLAPTLFFHHWLCCFRQHS